jgi:hypothetical protein
MSDPESVDPTTSSSSSSGETAAAPPPRKRSTRFITPVLALLAALVVGGVAGVLIGQGTAERRPQAQGGPGAFVQNGDGPTQGGPGGGLTAGTIESIDGDAITLKLQDGSTVVVTADDDTAVTQTEDAEVSDLAEGDEILVTGDKDTDGNVAADSISEGGAQPFGGPQTQSSK